MTLEQIEKGTELIAIDECLCQFDIEGTFKRNNIPFKISDGDIYVGMLDDVMGDDD
jgi:hypothetical protein